jgi:hypothetical protein
VRHRTRMAELKAKMQASKERREGKRRRQGNAETAGTAGEMKLDSGCPDHSNYIHRAAALAGSSEAPGMRLGRHVPLPPVGRGGHGCVVVSETDADRTAARPRSGAKTWTPEGRAAAANSCAPSSRESLPTAARRRRLQSRPDAPNYSPCQSRGFAPLPTPSNFGGRASVSSDLSWDLAPDILGARFGSPGRLYTSGGFPTHVLTGMPLEELRASPEPFLGCFEEQIEEDDHSLASAEMKKAQCQHRGTGSARSVAGASRAQSSARRRSGSELGRSTKATDATSQARSRRGSNADRHPDSYAKQSSIGYAADGPRVRGRQALGVAGLGAVPAGPASSNPHPPSNNSDGLKYGKSGARRARGGLPSPAAHQQRSGNSATTSGLGPLVQSSADTSLRRHSGIDTQLPPMAAAEGMQKAPAPPGSRRAPPTGNVACGSKPPSQEQRRHRASGLRERSVASPAAAARHTPALCDGLATAGSYCTSAGSSRKASALHAERNSSAAKDVHHRTRHRAPSGDERSGKAVEAGDGLRRRSRKATKRSLLPTVVPPTQPSIVKMDGAPVVRIKKAPRCGCCHRKLKFGAHYDCRCDMKFCGACRYPEVHSCTYDHKTEGAKNRLLCIG